MIDTQANKINFNPTVSFTDLDFRQRDDYFGVCFDHFWRKLCFFVAYTVYKFSLPKLVKHTVSNIVLNLRDMFSVFLLLSMAILKQLHYFLWHKMRKLNSKNQKMKKDKKIIRVNESNNQFLTFSIRSFSPGPQNMSLNQPFFNLQTKPKNQNEWQKSKFASLKYLQSHRIFVMICIKN